jgi:hypothetical protein
MGLALTCAKIVVFFDGEHHRGVNKAPQRGPPANLVDLLKIRAVACRIVERSDQISISLSAEMATS